MLKCLTAGLTLLVLAGPGLAQTGTDRPTATGTGSTAAGSSAMNPGNTGPLSGTSPTQPDRSGPSPTPTPGQPSSTNPNASPSTPGTAPAR